MDDKSIEANASAIEPKEEEKVVSPQTEEDYEAKIKALEDEKAQLIKEGEINTNYKAAFLKEKSKRNEDDEDEGDDERMRRIAKETLAESRLVEIAQEQDQIIKKALKENKELKLAHLNKTETPPAAMGTHSESEPVKDTLVTPEQMAYFKSLGKDDKWIANYKKNLLRGGGR